TLSRVMDRPMNLPAWLDGIHVSLQLPQWQQFGLAFLLGSFAVATLSDLKRLSAQREFLEIWLLFSVAILLFDGYHAYYAPVWPAGLIAKWVLIAIFSILS